MVEDDAAYRYRAKSVDILAVLHGYRRSAVRVGATGFDSRVCIHSNSRIIAADRNSP
ncbi:uncharacterized protein PY1_contig-17-101 [Novosphingobium sp. PY1]|nr:hypothetical protein [Novosphingobium sp. PY1]GFM31404.1 uncharacterized protein PY1_contig-17-101 [Novosphingobium sp. PY1]